MDPFDALHALRAFRRSLYECLHRRGDALFELADAAILTADGGGVPSPVHLTASEHPASSWLGQPLRRAPARTNRRRSPAEAARPPSTRRKPNARLRRGHERVASVRRGVQSRARLLLPPLAPLGRPAHRCRMGLPVHRPTQLRARESDRPRGRGARPPHAGRQRGRRRAGESVRAPVARGGRGHPPVRLRRRLRSREATARTGRPPRADPRPFAGGSPLPRRSEPRRPARPPPPDGRVVMARRR